MIWLNLFYFYGESLIGSQDKQELTKTWVCVFGVENLVIFSLSKPIQCKPKSDSSVMHPLCFCRKYFGEANDECLKL